MRLWTLHPKYLDPQGLVALWREALLAQRVLEGRTRGYRNHPQLERFRESPDPLAAIASYLLSVQHEATARGYAFNASLIARRREHPQMTATTGQLHFEARHLRAKLAARSPHLVRGVGARRPDPHPLFRVVTGALAPWERP
ncbi:MAG TPA: pyrimidine dimer DNA glycosylase/endonuclease V [Thermoanaerobaculia bacterium]|nr:pyrimidine dimer DNA glycosylase/endonuclease V [Thermoanaerobaculia bacterium]